MNITNEALISKDLTAKIKSISNRGLITVAFNNPILIPNNYNKFTDLITLLEI